MGRVVRNRDAEESEEALVPKPIVDQWRHHELGTALTRRLRVLYSACASAPLIAIIEENIDKQEKVQQCMYSGDKRDSSS